MHGAAERYIGWARQSKLLILGGPALWEEEAAGSGFLHEIKLEWRSQMVERILVRGEGRTGGPSTDRAGLSKL